MVKIKHIPLTTSQRLLHQLIAKLILLLLLKYLQALLPPLTGAPFHGETLLTNFLDFNFSDDLVISHFSFTILFPSVPIVRLIF